MTTAPVQPMITARGVDKCLGEHLVLDSVDLSVAAGTVTALLGPNRSGKTTLVRALSTLLAVDAGQLAVDGHDVATDPDGVRAAIGVTGQFSAVDNLLTGRENLQLMADLRHLGRERGRRRVSELLERFDLIDAAGVPASCRSAGQGQPARRSTWLAAGSHDHCRSLPADGRPRWPGARRCGPWRPG
jgi:ABC-2 type transport system ATP-binding protein